jgi:hypothetical protein
VPWDSSINGRHLQIDLSPGIRGAEWEHLLDGIIQELASVDRVTFLLPQGFETSEQGRLLDVLARALTAGGLKVERRQVP